MWRVAWNRHACPEPTSIERDNIIEWKYTHSMRNKIFALFNMGAHCGWQQRNFNQTVTPYYFVINI